MTDTAGKQDPTPLDEFSSRLEAARKAADPDAESPEAVRGRAMGKGFRLASELIAAMIVGPGLGLLVDRVAGVAPWGMLVGILLGFGAGIRNVAQAMQENRGGGDVDAAGKTGNGR
jgi:ATP synthase protein I